MNTESSVGTYPVSLSVTGPTYHALNKYKHRLTKCRRKVKSGSREGVDPVLPLFVSSQTHFFLSEFKAEILSTQSMMILHTRIQNFC